MRLRITKRQAEYLGEQELDELNIGIPANRWRWEQEQHVDLTRMSGSQIADFIKLVEAKKHVRGLGAMYTDVTTWRESFNIDIQGLNTKRCADCRQFAIYSKQVIKETAHRYLFTRADGIPGVYHPYYVQKITFVPKRRIRNDDGTYTTYPEYTTLELNASSLCLSENLTLTFYKHDCAGMDVKTALAKAGWMLETQVLWDAYAKDLHQYMQTVSAIGKQFLAHGHAELHEPESRRSNRYYSYQPVSEHYTMEIDGEPRKVVIDIFTESEKDDEKSKYGRLSDVDEKFWLSDEVIKANLKKTGDLDEEDGEEVSTDGEEERESRPRIQLPHHLFLVIFDLKRHMRFAIHMSFLEEYKFNTEIANHLILEHDEKELVTMLVEHSTVEFSDIVKGKSGGTIILLCGEPGTGKTLTAEVLAEFEKKPLYSVQASQLGTDENALEASLMKALGRAKRWNAVMLLDESDVYIHKRGDSIRQNAIVGVFLRVLEYYTSILFLTTNRPQDVDDAVASRCIAKVEYHPFKKEDTKLRAWKVLTKIGGLEIEEAELVKLSKQPEPISGRDIKNMTKLAKLYSKAKGQKVTAEVIGFLRKFKPTESE